MTDAIVQISQLTVQYAQQVVLDQLDWTVHRGAHWLIGGRSGSGKSVLAKALAGQTKSSGSIAFHFDRNSPLPAKVGYVSNWYQFTNLEGDRNFYYQQRYNKQQKNDTLTVYAELLAYAKEENLSIEAITPYLSLFEFVDIKNTQLIELSSGEHKKLQLIKALWLKPQLLIVDEPYSGLDTASRQRLNDYFDELAAAGVHLILITNQTGLPRCINRFAEIANGKLVPAASVQALSADDERTPQQLPGFLTEIPAITSDTVIHMEDVHIRYGEKEVLKGVSWTVRPGEKWLLQGHNGSGKSTLLSLVTGDHPQAYANHIELFGKRRGSGESIWDIKALLGIISPELHWYFDKTASVWQAVASGFHDSIGLFSRLTYSQEQQTRQLLDFFGLTADKDRLITALPLGKQRMALLARTMVKNPPLLILDEPCQGLDQRQTAYFNAVVDELCAFGKTLIYVGHYETQLPSCLDRKLVLERGEVKAIEEINELV